MSSHPLFSLPLGYFFELWRQDMLRETEREKNNRKQGHRGPQRGQNGPVSNDKSRQKKPRQPSNSREKYKQIVAQQEFLQDQTKGMYVDSNGVYYSSSSGYGTLQRPNSLEINQYAIENGHYGAMHAQYGYSQPRLVANSQYAPHPAAAQPQYNNGHPVQRQNSLTSPHGQQVANGHHHPGQPQSQPYPYAQPELANSQQPPPQNQSLGTPTRQQRGSIPAASRPSQPPPAPPSNPGSSSSSGHGTPTAAGTPSRSRGPSLTRDVLPPPPPPPPMPGMVNGGHDVPDSELPLPPMPQTQQQQMAKGNHIPNAAPVAAPPPPPPPPPVNGLDQSGGGAGANSKPTFAQQIAQGHKQLQPPKMTTMNKLLPHVGQQHVDARSGLLAAIREGIKLRRVEDTKQKEVDGKRLCNDVASILARRVAMELSDSDSGGNSDGSQSDGWDDESEC